MSRPLRLGMFTNGYPDVAASGGIPTYARALTMGLAALGHDVHLLVESTKERSGEVLAKDGATLHLLHVDYLPGAERVMPAAFEALAFSAKARALALRYRLDLFEFPNWGGMGAAYNAVRVGTPMVVRMHTSMREIVDIERTKMGHKERFACRLERRTCRSAHALYVSTKAHRHTMCEEIGIAEDRVGIVPLGIPDIEGPIRVEPAPRNEDPVILFLGRLETRKGVMDLLLAMKTVLLRMPRARLVLIGRDRPHAPGGRTHQAWADEHFAPDMRSQIEFLGFQDDRAVDDWFRRADLFVAPSLYESFGLIFVEAMRYAVPVIGARAGGIPEVVDHGRTGLLVDPSSPQQLSEAILSVLENEELRRDLGREGRRQYLARFSHVVMAERTVDHHREVLARLGRRS